jgi:hypothetical protein
MRIVVFGIGVVLLLAPLASAQEQPNEETLIKPLQLWEGGFDTNLPANGKYSVDVLTDAQAVAVPWKILRWGQKVPEINFKDHFAVLLIHPGSQLTLDGLLTDSHGNAKVAGFGYNPPVAVPKGKWYVLAVFPRDKVKSVNGVKIPAPK